MTMNMSAIMPLHLKHHANVSSMQTMSQMLVLLLALLTCCAKQAISEKYCHITFACWTAIRLWPPVSAAMLAAMKQQQHCFWTQWLFKHYLNTLNVCTNVFTKLMCITTLLVPGQHLMLEAGHAAPTFLNKCPFQNSRLQS